MSCAVSRRWRLVLAAAAIFVAVASLRASPASGLQPELRTLLSGEFKFSAADLADLENGQAVTHGLTSTAAGEIGAVGALRINAARHAFVARYRDITHFKRGAEVMEIGRFSDPPRVEDLAPLTISKQDVDLRGCRVGHCDIRLPAATIARFQREIDWKAKDADARAATLFKQVLFDDVHAFVSGGAGRIIEYDDEKRIVHPADDFAGLLENTRYMDEVAPGLAGHLKTFPSNPVQNTEDFLYWSKEKFGFTPFITVTQVTIMPATPTRTVIASRDVYSSRYFDASLTLTIASDAVGGPGAFYIVYVNRSRANALKGSFAGLRRSIVERRAKSSLDENLRTIKRRLEQNF